ncbi:MAG: hypothetical protein P8099_09795 [Gemmatimonadota bacterium]|jgi:epoxyqueuosine reductase QueG
MRRAGYDGHLRNIAMAIGNWLTEADKPPKEAVAVLRVAAEEDDPLVPEHAAWALERAG